MKCINTMDEWTDVIGRSGWQSDKSDSKKRTLNIRYDSEAVSTSVRSLAMSSGYLTATCRVSNNLKQCVFCCLQTVQKEKRVTAALKC